MNNDFTARMPEFYFRGFYRRLYIKMKYIYFLERFSWETLLMSLRTGLIILILKFCWHHILCLCTPRFEVLEFDVTEGDFCGGCHSKKKNRDLSITNYATTTINFFCGKHSSCHLFHALEAVHTLDVHLEKRIYKVHQFLYLDQAALGGGHERKYREEELLIQKIQIYFCFHHLVVSVVVVAT